MRKKLPVFVMASGCIVDLKIGQETPRGEKTADRSLLRPSTYVLPKPPPTWPSDYHDAWVVKSKAPEPVWSNRHTAAFEATNVAQAWMAHPANKMQLKSFQAAHDTDGDGLIDADEFKKLLAAAGSRSNAEALFNAMDKDGDGVLTADEIKALGQDSDGRAGRRG